MPPEGVYYNEEEAMLWVDVLASWQHEFPNEVAYAILHEVLRA